jgi:DNA-binding transcriptional LysR family regulator
VNIQHLRHLLAVAKYGNLLLAARELNISQSGLSRSISGLESLLGVPLFVRRARGVSLTDAGHDFLRRAQAILNEFDRATAELNAEKDMRAGRVTMGINNSFAHYITPSVIVDILKKAANLEFQVATHNYYELIDNLLANRYDFGMSVYFKSEMHEELSYEDLFPFESMVFCNANHPLAKAKQVTPEDLSKCRWALLEGKGAREGFEYFFRLHQVPEPPVALQSASLTCWRAWSRRSIC